MCYIFVPLLLMQMFSGIIIDKFGQLRDFELQKATDVKEMCFICGNSRYQFRNLLMKWVYFFLSTRELFDRKSDSGFTQHIKNDHYLWNYVFYLAYLEAKEPTEYTGIESYISDKLSQVDYSWFPI